MSELILHHYDASPFAAKIRSIFGYKGLAWRSVQQPSVMPKPALLPLTGGYRKIPVLQIGADIYCDTALIARTVETLHPTPSIYPNGSRGLADMLAHWADHWLFGNAAPPTLIGLLDKLPETFLADRTAMGMRLDASTDVSHFRSQLLAALDWLEVAVAEQPFVLGEQFSLVDASVLASVGFARRNAELFAAVAARPAVNTWLERVKALGTGERSELDAEEALEIARTSTPNTRQTSDGSDPNGLQPGERIIVSADDYGRDAIEGEAVVVTRQEIALRRQDDRLGEIVVHFPRAGFRVRRG